MSSNSHTTAESIRRMKENLPLIIMEEHFRQDPSLVSKYNDNLKSLYLQDTAYHLSYLAESVYAEEPVLFNEYLSWLKIFFENLPVSDDEILHNLRILRDILSDKLPSEAASLVQTYLNMGMDHYNNYTPEGTSFIKETNPHYNVASDFLKDLLNGDKDSAYIVIMKAINSGITIKDLYLDVFQQSQREVGRLWQTGKINVAQEHYITAATQSIIAQLYPYLFNNDKKDKKIIVCCINGELHELAARMVADIFELEGWDSYYLGANTPTESLISLIGQYKPDIVAISVTMTFNIPAVSDLISKIRELPDNNNIKVIAGGYPFNITGDLWKRVGADGFAADALGAVEMAEKLCKK